MLGPLGRVAALGRQEFWRFQAEPIFIWPLWITADCFIKNGTSAARHCSTKGFGPCEVEGARTWAGFATHHEMTQCNFCARSPSRLMPQALFRSYCCLRIGAL